MARILGLDEVDSTLKAQLSSSLRVYDEAVVLPQAHRSAESGAFKNVAMRLDGVEKDISSAIFSPDWFSGVSAVAVPSEIAEPLLKDPRKREEALRKLVQAIPSEMDGSDVTVGPALDGDENDRDTAPWTPGFDTPGCCVGLYSAQQSRAPDATLEGMRRLHNAYFLVCKAGGGLAAQTFHTRLSTALDQRGMSLDEALNSGTCPGPQALRRVSLAAQRNRGRILELAARALGFTAVDTIGDNASPVTKPHRLAITHLNVSCNVIKEVDSHGRSQWQYTAGCVDAATSQGLMSSSNPQEGFLVFTSTQNSYKVNLRNQAYNCLPFASVRIAGNRDTVMRAADAHRKAIDSGVEAHPDSSWTRERFGWRDKGEHHGIQLEPPQLWGTYASEAYVNSWARELGISAYRTERLQPEIVAVAGTEAAKVRAAARHISKR